MKEYSKQEFINLFTSNVPFLNVHTLSINKLSSIVITEATALGKNDKTVDGHYPKIGTKLVHINIYNPNIPIKNIYWFKTIEEAYDYAYNEIEWRSDLVIIKPIKIGLELYTSLYKKERIVEIKNGFRERIIYLVPVNEPDTYQHKSIYSEDEISSILLDQEYYEKEQSVKDASDKERENSEIEREKSEKIKELGRKSLYGFQENETPVRKAIIENNLSKNKSKIEDEILKGAKLFIEKKLNQSKTNELRNELSRLIRYAPSMGNDNTPHAKRYLELLEIKNKNGGLLEWYDYKYYLEKKDGLLMPLNETERKYSEYLINNNILMSSVSKEKPLEQNNSDSFNANTYTEYKELKRKQNAIVDTLSDKLNSYQKGNFGMIEESVRKSDEFRLVKKQYDHEFKKLQNINSNGVKKYKKEIRAELYNKKEMNKKEVQKDNNESDNFKGEGSQEGKGKLYEFFTPQIISDKMVALAQNYGFKGGYVLDPAAGNGRLLKNIPNAKITAFEINPKNAEDLRTNFPNAKVYNMNFEKAFLKEPRFNSLIDSKGRKSWLSDAPFDLVIANPPYGGFTGMYSSYFKHKGQFEHFFILQSLNLLKKGGIGVYIVPSSFLRNGITYNGIKKDIFDIAEFTDAYRLPVNAFKHTQIGTDIIVLTKK